ncbi:MAG: glycosyltransferase family 9 protein [Cyanobacteria bacterium P01_A01_bin.114]
MRVLALVPGGISEQLLFLPTLEDIKRAFPKAEIDVVVEPRAKSAYQVSKLVDEVIPFDFLAANSPADWANLLGIVRDREFEVAISTSGRWEEGVLLWLSGVPTRITYKTTRTPWLYTRVVPYQNSRYKADLYHDLVKGLNLSSRRPALSLNLPEGDLAWADAMREQMGLKGGYVLAYPGAMAGSSSQADPDRYPIESWLTIFRDFQAKQPQLSLVLLKMPDSQAAVGELTQQMPELKGVVPENMGQMAALIAGADLVLSPDSDILQLAIALNVFTLGLLSNATPETLLPPAQEAASKQTEKAETRFVAVKSTTSQLKDLPPEKVLKQIWGD